MYTLPSVLKRAAIHIRNGNNCPDRFFQQASINVSKGLILADSTVAFCQAGVISKNLSYCSSDRRIKTRKKLRLTNRCGNEKSVRKMLLWYLGNSCQASLRKFCDGVRRLYPFALHYVFSISVEKCKIKTSFCVCVCVRAEKLGLR